LLDWRIHDLALFNAAIERYVCAVAMSLPEGRRHGANGYTVAHATVRQRRDGLKSEPTDQHAPSG
jgi:hypothetical protein